MESVSERRLRADLEANAEFGAIEAGEGRGRTVLCGTDANRAARERLVDRMEAADLDVRVDAVGTVAGTWTPASADPDAAPVAAGSHLDSVPEGGIFDGPLGVYAALEAVRAMQDAGVEPARPVTVVSFTEEEGARFGAGLLGSSVAAGVRPVEDALALTDESGTSLGDALDAIGFHGEGRIDASGWDAFLELHVEQGRRLERAGGSGGEATGGSSDRRSDGGPVGVVTTVTGIAHYRAVVEGEADHAGTTPMDERRDALAAAAEVVRDVERAGRDLAADRSESAVATVGSLDASPNATNVVPGRVELGVDLRDVERATMDELAGRLSGSLARVADERGVETDLTADLDVAPRATSDRCRDALHGGAEAAGVGTVDLHSGAAHDAMHVARVTDAGMLFAPSVDGVSHSPSEWTDWGDCATATRVLANAVAELAT